MLKRNLSSRKQGIIILILFLAVIMVVSGCWKKEVKTVVEDDEQKVDNQEEQEEEIAATTDEIDISDWQTYRNKEYGFEVKYPRGWKAGEEEQIQQGKLEKIVIVHNPQDKNCAINLLISKGQSHREKVQDTPTIIFLNDIFIGGYKTYSAYKEDNLNQWFHRYFIRTKDKNLQFCFVPSEHATKEILYRILSTIKFID